MPYNPVDVKLRELVVAAFGPPTGLGHVAGIEADDEAAQRRVRLSAATAQEQRESAGEGRNDP